MRENLLIVDDEEPFRLLIGEGLRQRGYRTEDASSCHEAIAAVQRREPDLAIVDYMLPDGNALDLLSRWRESEQSFPVIVLTGYGSIDLAVRSIKDGAENFLTKPPDLDALAVIVQRALENARNRRGRQLRRRALLDPFVGSSPAILRLKREASKVLRAPRPILIQGETGTGKGVLAVWLHRNGPRADEELVAVNCAQLSRELLDSELFGHDKGAFTGATAAKKGLLEIAHRGTLFLDEIGDLDLDAQPKLLRVLEEKRFRRLGSTRDRRVDVQLIASTHRDVTRMVDEGALRSDLYFRLSTIPLTMPSLRERTEDIVLLAESFLAEIGTEIGRPNLRLTEDAKHALVAHWWRGNVRELRNVMERAALLADDTVLAAADLHLSPGAGGASGRDSVTLEAVETRHIREILAQENGHVPRAAERLGIPRSTLYQKIKKLGISLPGN